MTTPADPPVELTPVPPTPRRRGIVRRMIVTLFWLIFIFLFPNLIKGAAGAIGGKAAEQALDRWCKQYLPEWMFGGNQNPPPPKEPEPVKLSKEVVKPAVAPPSGATEKQTPAPAPETPPPPPKNTPNSTREEIAAKQPDPTPKPKLARPQPVSERDIK